MVIEVGKLAGNAIVPYSQSTKRTKWIDVTVTGASATTISNSGDLEALFYADSSDNWFVRLRGTFIIVATATSAAMTLADIVIKDASTSVVSTYGAGGNIAGSGGSLAVRTTNIITVFSSATNTIWGIDILIPLASEPTTYTTTANMEASTQADIYIEPASATQSGLVNTSAQSFAGVKTFNDGIVFTGGGSTLDWYQEDTWTPVFKVGGAVVTNSAVIANYTRIGNVVHIQMRVIFNGLGGELGELTIEDFPYDPITYISVPIGTNKISYPQDGPIMLYGTPGSTAFQVKCGYSNTGTSVPAVTNANLTVNSNINAMFSYII